MTRKETLNASMQGNPSCTEPTLGHTEVQNSFGKRIQQQLPVPLQLFTATHTAMVAWAMMFNVIA